MQDVLQRVGARSNTPNKYCVVFNIRTTQGDIELQPRVGSDIDLEKIKKTFKDTLKYDFKQLQDPSCNEVLRELKRVAQGDEGILDTFVCFFLSHGKMGHIFAHDDIMGLDEIILPIAKSKALKNTMKLYFIQACQDERVDQNLQTEGWSYEIPSYPNVFVGFATPPGYAAWRSGSRGSYFVNALCDTIDECVRKKLKKDVVSLMTKVIRFLASSFESSAPGMEGKKQAPCIFSSLTRKVYITD